MKVLVMKILLPDSGVFSAAGRRHVKYNCASELVLKLRNRPKSYETTQHQSSGGDSVVLIEKWVLVKFNVELNDGKSRIEAPNVFYEYLVGLGQAMCTVFLLWFFAMPFFVSWIGKKWLFPIFKTASKLAIIILIHILLPLFSGTWL